MDDELKPNPPFPPSSSRPPSESSRAGDSSGATAHEELVRAFNTSLVSTRKHETRDFPAEIYTLVNSPAFKAILAAIQELAQKEGISDREASDRVIETFRKMDGLWSDYLFWEGVDRLRNQVLSTKSQ